MYSNLEILIVEDLADDRDLISHLLGKHMDNVHVTCEDQRDKVLALLQQKNFDAIIIDYFLKGYTGLDLIDEIRGLKGFELPIIMITAVESEDVAMKCIQHGVDDFIIKTLKGVKELPNIISRAIGRADIHKIKFTAEHRIINTMEIFQNVYENASELIFTVWPDGTFVNANEATLKTLGINRQDLSIKNFVEFIDSDCRGRFKSALSQVFSGGKTSDIDLVLRNVSGKLINTTGHGHPHMANGKVVAANWILKNVTSEKYMESLIWDDYKQYSGIFDFIPAAVFLSDYRGVILQANTAACTLLGYELNELQGLHVEEITHPDDIKITLEYRNKLMKGELDNYTLEKRYKHKSGNYIWVEMSGSMVKNQKGEPLYAIAHVKEISELKYFEELLGKLAQDLTKVRGEEVFGRLSARLIELIQSDYVFICYVGKDSGPNDIYTLLLRDKSTNVADSGFSFPHELLKELIAEDELIVTNGLTREGKHVSVAEKMSATDLVAIPMYDINGRVLGILGTIFKQPTHKQSMITTLLRIAGSKISNQLQHQEAEYLSKQEEDN